MIAEENPEKSRTPTMARSGRDIFRTEKKLTVVMVPYERFSPFPKAIDELYKNIESPFNLIVVEGNAPECVRFTLEKKQRRYRNIVIIYSKHRPSISGAFNLAIPHIKTPYAFFMDNGVRIRRSMVERLLCCAEENKTGIVCPPPDMEGEEAPMRLRASTPSQENIEQIGITNCFLMTQSALRRIGKFDENVNPLTIGLDLALMAKSKGVEMCTDPTAGFECFHNEPLQPMDTGLYSFQ